MHSAPAWVHPVPASVCRRREQQVLPSSHPKLPIHMAHSNHMDIVTFDAAALLPHLAVSEGTYWKLYSKLGGCDVTPVTGQYGASVTGPSAPWSAVSGQPLQRLQVGRAGDAALGDDGRHVFRRRHVESRVFDGHTVGRHLLPCDVSDFPRIALLDGNVVTVRAGEVDGRNGRGHVERDAILFGQNGNGIGSDFVSDVTIGRDAVRAYDDGSD